MDSESLGWTITLVAGAVVIASWLTVEFLVAEALRTAAALGVSLAILPVQVVGLSLISGSLGGGIFLALIFYVPGLFGARAFRNLRRIEPEA